MGGSNPDNPSPLRVAQHLSPEGRGGSLRGTHPSKRPAGATFKARSLRKNETGAEYRLWGDLKAKQLNGYKFVRQIPLGHYIVDFLCREYNLVVELDGSQHADSNHDTKRTNWLNDNGYSVLRFWNEEVLHERRSVLETIWSALEGRINSKCEITKYWPATSSTLGERCRAKRGGEGAEPKIIIGRTT